MRLVVDQKQLYYASAEIPDGYCSHSQLMWFLTDVIGPLQLAVIAKIIVNEKSRPVNLGESFQIPLHFLQFLFPL